MLLILILVEMEALFQDKKEDRWMYQVIVCMRNVSDVYSLKNSTSNALGQLNVIQVWPLITR